MALYHMHDKKNVSISDIAHSLSVVATYNASIIGRVNEGSELTHLPTLLAVKLRSEEGQVGVLVCEVHEYILMARN